MLKLITNDHCFTIFSHFGLFPKVFEQVNEWPILKVHNIIRVLQVVACPINFNLFYGRHWQGSVFKVMKNDHFLVFLDVLFLFPKFLGRLRSNFC